MTDILIRNVPEDIKNQLKKRANSHHRSVTKEIYAILEESLLGKNQLRECPEPYKGKFEVTNQFINEAKKWDRK